MTYDPLQRPAPRDFAARVKEMERQRRQLRGISDYLAGKDTPETREIFLNINDRLARLKNEKGS